MSTKMKKISANTRLDFVRQNNQFAAAALLKNDEIRCSIQKPPLIEVVKPQVDFHLDKPYEPVCICNRKSQVVQCQICKMLFYGRISEKCLQHPNVTYLLDLFYCPKCAGPKENLKVKTLDSTR